MKIVDGKMYLEFSEMVECGVSDVYMRKAKSIGTKCWQFINDPADKRKVLVDYDRLQPIYKKMVTDRYGNPWEHVAREPLLAMVVQDAKALEFYAGYRYLSAGAQALATPKNLPTTTIVKYTRAASWLQAVNDLHKNREAVMKQMGMGYDDLYRHVSALIALEKERGKMEGYAGVDMLPGDFPSSRQRLLEKVKRFVEGGYETVIAPEFGNKLASKLGKVADNGADSMALAPINDTENGEKLPVLVTENGEKKGDYDPELANKQIAVIRALCEKHNNFDAGQVAKMAEIIFEANGWQSLTRRRIHQIMNENEELLKAARRGTKAHRSENAMQVKRTVTEIPLVYWTMDGWTAELMYKDGSDFKRLVVVVVLDAWMKYPVGYAIGERETAELIREALRNAVLHTQDLFGSVYCPVQLQSDNYQIKHLTPFYQAVAHLHTPAAVGNAKAKVVEPYFRHLNKTYCQMQVNWTGHNVTARKENQVNAEMTDKLKHSFPDKEGVRKQITAIIAKERNKKREEYVSTFDELPADRRYTMDAVQWLEVFGTPVGKTNRMSGAGLVKQIDGERYFYDSFDPAFRSLRHLNWQIVADRADLSKVLAVSEDGTRKFLLEHVREVPMDVLSATEDDHEYRARVARFNKEQETFITDTYGQDADTAREVIAATPLNVNDDEELAVKLMLTYSGQQKERLQTAKTGNRQLPTPIAENDSAAEWRRAQMERMNNIVDFSIFQ